MINLGHQRVNRENFLIHKVYKWLKIRVLVKVHEINKWFLMNISMVILNDVTFKNMILRISVVISY